MSKLLETLNLRGDKNFEIGIANMLSPNTEGSRRFIKENYSGLPVLSKAIAKLI